MREEEEESEVDDKGEIGKRKCIVKNGLQKGKGGWISREKGEESRRRKGRKESIGKVCGDKGMKGRELSDGEMKVWERYGVLGASYRRLSHFGRQREGGRRRENVAPRTYTERKGMRERSR